MSNWLYDRYKEYLKIEQDFWTPLIEKCCICNSIGELEVWMHMLCIQEKYYTIVNNQAIESYRRRWYHESCYNERTITKD